MHLFTRPSAHLWPVDSLCFISTSRFKTRSRTAPNTLEVQDLPGLLDQIVQHPHPRLTISRRQTRSTAQPKPLQPSAVSLQQNQQSFSQIVPIVFTLIHAECIGQREHTTPACGFRGWASRFDTVGEWFRITRHV
jgi:hypothetical protein